MSSPSAGSSYRRVALAITLSIGIIVFHTLLCILLSYSILDLISPHSTINAGRYSKQMNDSNPFVVNSNDSTQVSGNAAPTLQLNSSTQTSMGRPSDTILGESNPFVVNSNDSARNSANPASNLKPNSAAPTPMGRPSDSVSYSSNPFVVNTKDSSRNSGNVASTLRLNSSAQTLLGLEYVLRAFNARPHPLRYQRVASDPDRPIVEKTRLTATPAKMKHFNQ